MADTTNETKCWFCQTKDCESRRHWRNCRCLQIHALKSPTHPNTVVRILAVCYEAFLSDVVPTHLTARFPPDHTVPEACPLAESLFDDAFDFLDIAINSCQDSKASPMMNSFEWRTFTNLSQDMDVIILARLRWHFHSLDDCIES